MCRLSWNLGTSTSWNPQGLSRPVMGLLYLYILTSNVYIFITEDWYLNINIRHLTKIVIYCLHNEMFNRLNRIRWFGHVQRTEETRIPPPPKKILYMNSETTRLIGRPRNRWQAGVREDGRLVGGKGWKERIYNRGEWKKFMRMTRDRRILHMPTGWRNGWM